MRIRGLIPTPYLRRDSQERNRCRHRQRSLSRWRARHYRPARWPDRHEFWNRCNTASLDSAGKVRAIAYTGATRNRACRKCLHDRRRVHSWGSIRMLDSDLGSCCTSRSVTERLYAAINEALRVPELTASFVKLGFDVLIKQQPDLDSFISSEAQRWPPIVKAAGLMPE